MTYNELRESIKRDCSSNDPAFLAEIDTFIKQAEAMIWAAVRLPAFTATTEIQLSAQDETSQVPLNFLSMDHIAIQGLSPLQKKDSSFIRELYPVKVYASPRFYALEDDITILWGPAPDQDYIADMNYYCQPKSLIDARDDETYTSDKFPTALLQGSKVFAHQFLRDPESMQSAMDLFDKSLALADGYSKGRFAKQEFEKNSPAIASKELR